MPKENTYTNEEKDAISNAYRGCLDLKDKLTVLCKSEDILLSNIGCDLKKELEDFTRKIHTVKTCVEDAKRTKTVG